MSGDYHFIRPDNDVYEEGETPFDLRKPREDRIAFEGRLSFAFDAEGLLVVAIANVQHVLMPEEVDQLRCWLAGQDDCED